MRNLLSGIVNLDLNSYIKWRDTLLSLNYAPGRHIHICIYPHYTYLHICLCNYEIIVLTFTFRADKSVGTAERTSIKGTEMDFQWLPPYAPLDWRGKWVITISRVSNAISRAYEYSFFTATHSPIRLNSFFYRGSKRAYN